MWSYVTILFCQHRRIILITIECMSSCTCLIYLSLCTGNNNSPITRHLNISYYSDYYLNLKKIDYSTEILCKCFHFMRKIICNLLMSAYILKISVYFISFPSRREKRLTRTRMKRLWSNNEWRTHRVEREFLKIITCLLREDLVNHESLVAPPGSFQLPRGGEPQLGLTVHDLSLCVVRNRRCTKSSVISKHMKLQPSLKPTVGVHALKQLIAYL